MNDGDEAVGKYREAMAIHHPCRHRLHSLQDQVRQFAETGTD